MRRLLPRLPKSPPQIISPQSSQLSSQPSQNTIPRKRQQLAAAACEVCRSRKTKCDGERPRCKLCTQRNIECQYVTAGDETRSQAKKRKYEELQSDAQDYKELLSVLVTLSPEATQDVLRRIRCAENVQSVLRHIRHADLLLQVSLKPEVRLRYDFPYRSQMPSSLMMPNNQYLKSCVYEAVRGDGEVIPSASASTPSLQHAQSPYTIPYHAARIVEPVISRITARPWTIVGVADDMVRTLLEGYFAHQYPYLSQFHKDLFLEAMANGRRDLCSPLLVNAVLAAACQTVSQLPDRASFWRPETLQYRFLAETRRLLELEAGRPSLTTIQALLIMHQAANMNGLDKVGMAYLLQAMSMAYKLDLFRDDPNIRSPRIRRARSVTAWGLFIWQTQVCFYYHRTPLLEHPPDFPLPDPNTDRSWYGEIWLLYPGKSHPLPTYLGHTMKALATFRIIQNDLGARIYCENPPSHRLKLEDALHFKSRFDNWFSVLGDCLSPTKIVFPIQLKIHMEYYTNIISLLQPFESKAVFSSKESVNRLHETLQPTISTSRIAFETVLRIYYMRHSFESFDSALAYFLPFMFNMALKNLAQNLDTPVTASDTEEAHRSTLVLSAKGLQSHGRIHVLSRLIYQGLRGIMRPQDLDILHAYRMIDDKDEVDLEAASMAQAEFPVPHLHIGGNPDATRVKHLIQLYQQLDYDQGENS
ncbi:hypothetical protein G7054_g7627 [Neopestalotiopsis clavispora]|nr:hypothetical protein G7054_g7627 [Neopestalotiopsis clavispora]